MTSLILPAIAASLPGGSLWAQERNNEQAADPNIAAFGGPESVTEQLRTANEPSDVLHDWPLFDGYLEWKTQIEEDYDLSFGLYVYGLYQQAGNSLPGFDDDAMGDIFRFLGTWQLFERENGNLGRIEWRAESRSQLGGFQAPGALAGATGIATLAPGFAFADGFDMDLAVINWTQGFASGKAGYAVGRLAFDAYLDAFPFQTLSKGFINRSFILNPTLPTTGAGAIGGVAKGFVTDKIWLGGQIHDANAANGHFDFDTLGENEFIKALEVGYTPSFGRRRTHLVQLTYWDKDPRSAAGVSGGSGWAVSAAWKVNDSAFPFVRFGHSDGGGGVAAEEAFSAGVELTRPQGKVWTIGAGWARPSEDTFGPALDNETAIEMSYKFPVSRQLSLMPDAQIIFNPANNPEENSTWVISVRAILTL